MEDYQYKKESTNKRMNRKYYQKKHIRKQSTWNQIKHVLGHIVRKGTLLLLLHIKQST